MAARNGDVTLLLCVCGRTAWDLAGRVQGSADIPLSPVGREEVAEAVARADTTHLSAIWCAPDEASRETAKLVAEPADCRIRASEDLREVNLGLWEGSLASELTGRFAKAYRLWREDPLAVTPAEGEALADAQERLRRCLGRIVDKSGKGARAIVLRPLMMGLLKCSLTGEPASRLFEVMASQPQCEFITLRRADLSILRKEASVP